MAGGRGKYIPLQIVKCSQNWSETSTQHLGDLISTYVMRNGQYGHTLMKSVQQIHMSCLAQSFDVLALACCWWCWSQNLKVHRKMYIAGRNDGDVQENAFTSGTEEQVVSNKMEQSDKAWHTRVELAKSRFVLEPKWVKKNEVRNGKHTISLVQGLSRRNWARW